VTGLTPDGRKPTGFLSPIPVQKTTWGQWKQSHATTRLMIAGDPAALRLFPNHPLSPYFPMPDINGQPDKQAKVMLIGSNPPMALPYDPQDVGPVPINLSSEGARIVLFREEKGGRIRAFDRRIEDLSPQFISNPDAASRRKGAVLADKDTGTTWSADGRAASGELGRQNKRLTPVTLEEGVYWGVMKFWMPELAIPRSR
jgi:hypothetical protein